MNNLVIVRCVEYPHTNACRIPVEYADGVVLNIGITTVVQIHSVKADQVIIHQFFIAIYNNTIVKDVQRFDQTATDPGKPGTK